MPERLTHRGLDQGRSRTDLERLMIGPSPLAVIKRRGRHVSLRWRDQNLAEHVRTIWGDDIDAWLWRHPRAWQVEARVDTNHEWTIVRRGNV